MKKYSVKQIADMLNTNPETVRRWIRDGKLKAVQVSRKDGNMIDENEFQRFIKAAPKYANIVARSSAYMPSYNNGLVGVKIGSLVASLVLGYCDDRINRDFQISTEDIENYIIDIISSYEESIKNKSQDINRLTDEITEERKKIDELKLLLEHNKTGNELENKKSSIKKEGKKNG